MRSRMTNLSTLVDTLEDRLAREVNKRAHKSLRTLRAIKVLLVTGNLEPLVITVEPLEDDPVDPVLISETPGHAEAQDTEDLEETLSHYLGLPVLPLTDLQTALREVLGSLKGTVQAVPGIQIFHCLPEVSEGPDWANWDSTDDLCDSPEIPVD